MNKLLKYLCKYSCILFSVLYLNGQNQIEFEHIDVVNGLSNGSVTDIVQDSIGFIWVASKNGLNRYDGSSFKVYNQQNSTISTNDISALKIDRQGRMWVGTTGGGLNIYNSFKDNFTVYKNDSENNNSIASNEIHTIYEDKNGRIWIGTEEGLNLYIEETNSFITYKNNPLISESISHNSVWSIYEQENGDFWIGTYGGGLNKFDRVNNQFVRYSSIVNFPIDFINAITSVKENELLIGSNDQGLIRLNLLDNTAGNFFEKSEYEDVSVVRTLWIDNEKNLWIGTDGNGLLKVSKLKTNKFIVENYLNDSRSQSTLSNNTLNVFFEDNQSNIWIGTAWKGVNIIEHNTNNTNFYYSNKENFNGSPVLSIYKDKSDLWMGTDGEGISIYNDLTKKIKYYNKDYNSSIEGDFIQCIKPTGNNKYWIGTFSNGLILFDLEKGSLAQYKRETSNVFSLPYNDVRDVIELDSGDLWVGTWGGGLSYFNAKTKKFKNYRHSNNINSISSDNVLSLLKNKDGSIWVGTYGGGLNLFDPKTEKFTHFMMDEENPDLIGTNYVFSLLKGKKGYLWIGTKEGLYRFNSETLVFEKFIVGNTVNSNTIVGLIQDNEGHIWMSTKEGIYKYNSSTKIVETVPDITEEFHINAVFKDLEGVLYFGSAERVVSFNPELISMVSYNPPIVLTDFKLFNKSVEIDDTSVLNSQIYYSNDIVLKHNQNVLTFNFSALKYPNSNKEQFAVKMEGFDEEWRWNGTQKSTTFTNLSPGDYIFKVKRQTVEGEIIENNIASLNITISPPFWKTWWAYILYFILLVLLLLAYRNYTFRWVEMKNKLKLEKIHRAQEDKLHELKQKFFTNISHEIRTPLTLILGPLNSLLKRGNFNAGQQRQMATVKNNTNRLLNLVNELLNFRKLETGHVKLKVVKSNIVEFVNEIYLSYSQLAINKGIKYELEFLNENIQVFFDKVQLEKAIYNLISNAFKFTENGDTIKVSIRQEEKFVFINVSDTGKGIPKEKLANVFERFYQNENEMPENKGFGIGLSIAKDIVELHSGAINVKSQISKGSQFSIQIPLGKDHFKEDELKSQTRDGENIKSYIPAIYDVDEQENNTIEDFTGESILLIEDNIHIRKYLKDLLSETYVIFEASNGKEGLEKAIEFVPDLVVSDIMMPIMDGVSFCSNLKTDIRISHIPVILLTARTLITDKIEGFETGADDYLTKPFNEVILKVRIKNLLRNRMMLRERYLKEGILNPKEIALNSPDEEFLTKLVTIVEEHIEESEFNIDMLSKSMAMGHSNVYKKVKALTGMTLVGFVKDFRLKRAAQLFKQNKISIIDACFMVGYTDRRHFSQEFKKKFGLSPTAYIKENLVE